MKTRIWGIAAVLLFVAASCQQPAKEKEEVAKPEEATPDYAAFEKKVAVVRNAFQAHSDENLELQMSYFSDTLKVSPPFYNGNVWLGKEDLKNAVAGYHADYDNITFHEGRPRPPAPR